MRKIQLFLLLLTQLAVGIATAAPWSTSKPHTTDAVRLDFVNHRYGTLLVAAPSVSGEYRAEIERQTALRIARNTDKGATALAYLGAFGSQVDLPAQDIEKKLNVAGVDGVIVIDLHGALKNEWDTTQSLNVLSLGTAFVAPEYKDVPLRERDSAKRKIDAHVVLFDFASKKIAWEAEIKIDVVRKRADGAHVAEYIAKQIGKSLAQRGLVGSKVR